jgi:O-antigen/teichoic acid export membrane protein
MAAPSASDATATPVATGAELAPPLPEPDGPSVMENSAVNVLGLLLANGLSAVGGLVTAIFLGATNVGVLAVVFGLVEFGRSLSSFTHNPSILEYHRNPDPGRVFGTSLILKLVGSTLFVALAAVLDAPLAALFKLPPWTLTLTSVVILLGAFNEIGTARLEAEHRVVRRNLILALGPAVGLLAVLAFILAGRYDLYAAIVTSLVGTAVMGLAFAMAWPRPWRFRFDRDVARYLVGYGSRIVVTGVLAQALIWTDTLMISHYMDNEAAGVYNIAFQLTFVMVVASVSVGTALLPAMSQLAGRGESTALAYQRGTLLSLALSVLLALAYVVAGRLLLSFYGAEFASGYVPLLVLTVFGIAGALAVPAASTLTVHGHAGTLTLISLGQALLNVVLNYVFIQSMGTTGAALATTSVFVLGTLLTWIVVKRVTGAWPLSVEVWREARLLVRAKMGRRV